MEPSEIKPSPSPIQYVDTTLLSANVCKTLEVKNVVPSKTPKLIKELGNVLSECIERNKTDKPSKLLVFPAKTGTSKSLTTKTYISLLKDTASIVVVPTVDDAIEYCKDINAFSGDSNYARCYYSISSRADNALRVDKSALTNHRCIVITHQMYLRANKKNHICEFNFFGLQKRDLVVIDERINLSENISINDSDVDNLIKFIKELQKSKKYSNLEVELDQLLLFKYYMNREREYCTDHNSIEAPFEPLYNSSEEPWSFGSMESILTNNPNAKLCKLYGHSPSTRTADNEIKLRHDLQEQLRVIQLTYFEKHTFHKQGEESTIRVHSLIDSHFGSAVVLDATANINAHYKALEKLRPNDMELYSPTDPRVYNNFTINQIKGYKQGRSAMYKGETPTQLSAKANEYLKFARSLIKSPDDKVLMVTFKDFSIPLKKLIKAGEPISVTHYGNHVGKNDWSDHNKVIIIGWNYQDKADIVSNFIGTTGDLDTSFSYDIKEIKYEYEKTGIVDDLVQATMRGTARLTVDTMGNCPESEVYLFSPDSSLGNEIVNMYKNEFIGAKVIECTPTISTGSKKLSSKTKNRLKILDYLDKEQKRGEGVVKDTDVKNETGIPRSTYSDIVKDSEFLELLHQKGYRHDKIDGKSKGFYLVN